MSDALKQDAWPRSHYDVIEQYHGQYDRQIASGEYQPFLYPWSGLGAAVVIAYLLIPHEKRPWLKHARYLVFVWITGFAGYSILYTRAKGMAHAFGVGLLSAWSVAWVSAILVCNDAQTDFQRIERLEASSSPSLPGSSGRSNKKKEEESKEKTMSTGRLGPNKRQHGGAAFAWQPYPSSSSSSPLMERVDWVLDLFCTFRGAGWSWRPGTIPPPPKDIQEQLGRNSQGAAVPKTSSRIHSGQVQAHHTREALLRANVKTLVQGYLVLDMIKTCVMHDPYFWGCVDRAPPDYFPFTLVNGSPVLVHMVRLTLSMLGIKAALQTIFSLGPLLFCFVLGPRLVGARAEPWMYPESWAPYTVVLDHGLAGWWGNWWHQTFRFAFQEPSRKLLDVLGMDTTTSHVAKAGQLVVAFAMSGLVHACGSYTAHGKTDPLANSFLFFLLQAVGIFAELGLSQWLKKKDLGQKKESGSLNRFPYPLYEEAWAWVLIREMDGGAGTSFIRS
ncbi:hypothetical protein ACEQ8H_003037 [Pleosporales sp. CAS-2024a]